MDLNLKILKTFPFRPGLFGVKMTGLPILIITKMANRRNKGERTNSMIKENRKSKIRLKHFLYTE